MKVSVEVERAALPDQGWQRVAVRARVKLCDRWSSRPPASIVPTNERIAPTRPALGGPTSDQLEQQMIATLERLGYERARARYMAAIQMQRSEQEIERRREDAH